VSPTRKSQPSRPGGSAGRDESSGRGGSAAHVKRAGRPQPAVTAEPVAAGANGTRSQRRDDVVRLAGELFAQKGFRATTVREIADAAGILSGSLYHHFDSKESIGDEILAGFLNDVLAAYRTAVEAAGDPRDTIERIVRTSSHTLARHRAALTMLQNDWSYFSTQPRFAYLRKDLREIERIWITQLARGKEAGLFREDLNARVTYRLFRDVLWLPIISLQAGGFGTDDIVDSFLRLLFDGIMNPDARPRPSRGKARPT
jgi:TetR/AcrR family transcriptional regulator, cholesterol catabolism regulator